MKKISTAIADVLLLQPQRHADDRGFLVERWNGAKFSDVVGEPVAFVQHNHASSGRGVLRGLHYQLAPHAQGKLVWASAGAVFDVAVDLRRTSPSFGRWVGTALSADNGLQMWIPPGFAHGFCVLGEAAEVDYLLTQPHVPEAQRSVRWDDATLAIAWPLDGRAPVLSPRDAIAPLLGEAELP